MSGAHRQQRAETAAERDARLAREAELIAEAEADAGLLIPTSKVDAWIDSLGTANELPLPQPAKPI